MLRIILGQGVSAEWLAGFLCGLLGEKLRYESDQVPPRYISAKNAWQLDFGEDFWLIHESGSAYRLEGRSAVGKRQIHALLDDIRRDDHVTSVTVVS